LLAPGILNILASRSRVFDRQALSFAYREPPPYQPRRSLAFFSASPPIERKKKTALGRKKPAQASNLQRPQDHNGRRLDLKPAEYRADLAARITVG